MIANSQSNVAAADRNADFIAKLRERGWDDTAVEYLDWVEKSPLITPQFRSELGYQRAMSRAAQGRQARSLAERERLLGESAAEFATFAKNNATSDVGLESQRQAANLFAEQALSILLSAKQLPEQAAAQREQARAQARDSFREAAKAAEQLAAQCEKQLASMPKAAAIQNDPAAKARLGQLRNRQVEARFLLARLAFEEAATYEPKSDEHAKVLEAASEQFGKLAEEHPGTLVETTARFHQGRCAQELGAYEKALGFFQELTRQPAADGEFRRWTARAHRRRAECLAAIGKLDDAIAGAEDWLAGSRPAEREQQEWLETQYVLADAYRAKSKEDQSGAGAKELQSKARNLLREVAKAPNEFQQDARLALASMGQGGNGAVQAKTFDEAFSAAKSSLELWNSSTLAAKLARENNPDAEGELKSEADEHRVDALRMLELTLDLADAQTPAEQLNAARYYLSVLYWEDKRPHEAAVLAEFLAKRYPESEFAAGAAKVALAAYEQLAIEARGSAARDSKPGEASYEAGKLAELSELVAARWPESAEASSAFNVLIQTALRENRLSDAEALLARLPEGSRSSAELSLGAGLWTQYLRATAGQRDSPSEAAIALRDKAGTLLKQGFEGVRKTGKLSTSAAVGALYLVQYQLAQGDAGGALAVLEDPKAGPLTLVDAQAEAAAKPEFVQETYKAALRAYLSVQPPRREEAEQMMNSLEEFVTKGNGESSGKQLTEIYLSLGVQLQRQMKELDAAGQREKAAQLATAFGDLLDRVAERPDANSWRIRTWLAQTNLQIGQALGGEEARAYADRAKKSYEAILAAAQRNPGYAPDAAALLGVRMRLGECFAAAGEYDKAIEQYGAILRERPNMLDLQQAAATALQQWGVAKKDSTALDRSIRGDLPQQDGKNLIWGWLRLAAMADAAKRQTTAGSSDPERAARFEDLFFEARYNVAKSRFLAGKITSSAEKRKQLEAARANIEQMQALYPELGGAKWKAAFDDLRKQIETELGK